MLFNITNCSIFANTGAINIFSSISGFVVLFSSEVYSLVILNDSNISSSTLMSIIL